MNKLKKIIGLYLLLMMCLLACSNGTNKINNEVTIKHSSFDSLVMKNDSINNNLIANFKIGKGIILPLKNTMSLVGIPAEEKTNIKVLNYGFNKYVNVKNMNNKISDDETYFQIVVNYNFFIDRIKEYDPNLTLSSYFHTSDWILLDTKNNYYKVLMSYSENQDSTMTLYFDGDHPKKMVIPPQVKDGFNLTDTINFKVPLTFSPDMLIYKRLNYYTPSNYFAVSFAFPQE